MTRFHLSLDALEAAVRRPAGASRFWLSKHCVWAAWLGLLVVVLNPPHGTGFTVCWMKAAAGIPCPGCGLTRSMSCALHGMFAESWHYHPLGTLILAMLLTIAAISLLPDAARGRIAHFIESHAMPFNAFYLSFVIVFVGFGALRALACLGHFF